MASEIDLNDPFLKLLTDALRAGPGSPEWHQAVSRLRESGNSTGGGRADEYRMLIAAREHLESGKEYRSVRAGPGFTRKLMHGIEEESSGGKTRGFPIATIIAILAGVAIVAIVAIVAHMVTRPPPEPAHATVEDLLRSRGELLNEIAVAKFDTAGAPIPDNWKIIGRLPLDTTRGLRPSPNVAVTEPATVPSVIGGGIVAPGSVPPDEPFVAEAYVHLGKPSDGTLVEFFVSTDSNFSPDRATSTSDVVWLLQGTQQKVMLSGREQADVPRPAADAKEPDGAAVPVRILMNRDVAVVESNGQRLWAGPHALPATPRYVGVRFLRTGRKGLDPAEVISVKVMKR